VSKRLFDRNAAWASNRDDIGAIMTDEVGQSRLKGAVSFADDGATIHVEWLRPLVGRLASLLFFAPALYLAYFLVIGIRQDLLGDGNLREDILGFLGFLAFILAVALPGYVLATFRYFVEIDKTSGETVVHRTFGPLLHVRFRRKLSEFTRVTIVRDLDPGDARKRSWFPVSLCGGEGTKPVKLASFKSREEADEFGKMLEYALRLKAEDLADTDPDDPDWKDEAKA
jgi:hypothetical protein